MSWHIVAWWHHMEGDIWVNIDSDNGLLLDGSKPLPELMLTYHWKGIVTFIWRQFHQRYISHHSRKLAWKSFIWNFTEISQSPWVNKNYEWSKEQLFLSTIESNLLWLWQNTEAWKEVSLVLLFKGGNIKALLVPIKWNQLSGNQRSHPHLEHSIQHQVVWEL